MSAGKLTDAAIAAAVIPAGQRSVVLTDGHGLRVRCFPDRREWQVRIKGSDHRLGLFPDMDVATARQAAYEARQAAIPKPPALAPVGIPSVAPAVAQAVNGRPTAPTFGEVGSAWLAGRRATRKANTIRVDTIRFVHLSPLHPLPIDQIDDAAHIRPVLKQIQAASGGETAKRAAALISTLFEYAQRDLRVKFTPPTDLGGMVDPFVRTHRKAVLDPNRLGWLIEHLNTWQSRLGPTVSNCARLQAHVFLRTSEIIGAKWVEIDWPAAVWRIPAERMKMAAAMRRARLAHHAVPLSRQALEILEEQRDVAGGSPFIFPHNSRADDHVTCGAITGLYKDQLKFTDHQPHGWRACFESMALEAGQDWLLTELCLAHKVKSIPYGAAYLRTDLIDRRRSVMQWWSDKLGELERGYKV